MVDRYLGYKKLKLRVSLRDLKMFYTSGERGRLKGRDCRDKGLLENIL
jgi:hypothetical protein